MANPEKPAFSFGQLGTSGASEPSLFGQASSTSQAPGAGLFGSTANPPASSGGGLFGSTPATSSGGTGLFGSAPTANQAPSPFGRGGGGGGTSNLFGGVESKLTTSNLFGQPSGGNAAPGTGLFGSTPASSQPSTGTGLFGSTPAPTTSSSSGGLFGSVATASQPANTATSSAPFSFATPNKSAESKTNQNQSSSLFGGANNAGGNSLFNLGSNATSTTSTTPTSKPTSSLFGNSTTPAGPPPSTGVGTSSLFNKPAGQDNPFGKPPTSAAPTPSLFSNITQSPNNSSKTANSSSAAPTSLFNASSKGGGDLFANKVNAPAGNTSFSNLGKPQDTPADRKANLFKLGGQPSSIASTAPTTATTTSAPAFSFLKPSVPTSAAPQAPSTSAAPGGSSLGGHAVTPATSPPVTSVATSSLFPPSKPPENAPIESAPSTKAPFFDLRNFEKPSSTTAQPAPLGTAKAASEKNAQIVANLSASTAGPLPPAQSRLKSKTMDDIITRWATDLAKYQKEFQAQAEKVAQWDRMLVDNSEKIQKLYGQTLEAERATTEVERQLSAVESDQMELEAWLNHYEKEVDSMIKQQGDGELATGPDAERQRTYQLASKLSDRLEDMGKDLGSMIDEINDASSHLSRNGKQDDPLSQVVRVLNTHLTQLQQIDQGAAALSLKVQEAQKAARRTLPGTNGAGGRGLGTPSSEAADVFYRSYMGRR